MSKFETLGYLVMKTCDSVDTNFGSAGIRHTLCIYDTVDLCLSLSSLTTVTLFCCCLWLTYLLQSSVSMGLVWTWHEAWLPWVTYPWWSLTTCCHY